MIKKIALTIVIIGLLMGCSTSSPETYKPKISSVPTSPKTDPAESQLAEAANSVSQSLLNLAEIQQASTPPPRGYAPPNPALYGMSNPITINWSGPLEPLLSQIANASGYTVKTLGNAPSTPLIVTVIEKNKPLGDVLRNAGYQVSKRAAIVIFPRTKTIELRYANH